jgi:hypothetical protein
VLNVQPGENVVQTLFDRLNALVFERNEWKRCAEERGSDLAALETAFHASVDRELEGAARAAIDGELERLQQILSGARSFTGHTGVRSVIDSVSKLISERRCSLKAA